MIKHICDDVRYNLSDYEREQFHEALFKELKRMLHTSELSIWDLIQLLHVENTNYYNACDTVVTTTYEEFN